MNNKEIINKVINDFEKSPLSLDEIGDIEGTKDYLKLLQGSYIRTFGECTSLLPDLNSTICEIGSYLGVLARALKLKGYNVNACDIPFFYDRDNVREYFKKYGINTFNFDLKDYRLPFNDSSQDMVIACEIIEHLNFNPLPVINEINRIMKTGGFLYISMPNSASLIKRIRYLIQGQQPCFTIKQLFEQLDSKKNMMVGLHWREYSTKETIKMVEPFGFELKSSKVCLDYGANYGSILKSILKKFIFLIPGCKPNQVVVFKKVSNSDIKLEINR